MQSNQLHMQSCCVFWNIFHCCPSCKGGRHFAQNTISIWITFLGEMGWYNAWSQFWISTLWCISVFGACSSFILCSYYRRLHLNPQWTAGMFMLQLCRLSRCIMLNSKTQADAQVRARGWRKVHLTQIIMLRNNNRTYIKHWYQEQAVPEWQSCFFVCSPLVSSWFSSWLFFQILLSLQCPECTSFYMYLFI